MRIAIIPARGGSKRMPGKNIHPFCGKPVIAYPLAAARASGLFDRIHVSTDDPEIRATVESLGFPVEFPRPSHLCDDHTPLLPVLHWVLDEYLRRKIPFDEVCLILPCSPLILAEDLVAACKTFSADPRRLPVLSAVEFPVPIEWALQEELDGRLSPVQPGKASLRSQDIGKKFYDSGNFIFYSAESIRSGEPPDARGYLAYHLPRARGLDIDSREDFELAELIYRGRERTAG